MNLCLEQFKERMPHVEAAKFLLVRRNKHRAIESRFSDCEWNAIMMSILCFIKEQSLDADETCTLTDIQRFLQKEVLPGRLNKQELRELARYCVVDVFQNGGKEYTYQIKDLENNGAVLESNIMLVESNLTNIHGEDRATYTLTSAGYDFLFRTYEVSQYYDIDIHAIVLKEQLVKGQYSKLEETAREWVTSIRKFLADMEGYERQITHDILAADISSLLERLHEFYAQTAERQKHARETLQLIGMQEEQLEEAKLTPAEREEVRKQLKATTKQIKKGSGLLQTCFHKDSEIRKMIDKELSRYVASVTTHFDMHKEILQPILEAKHLEDLNVADVLGPLMRPQITVHLTPGLFYQPQDIRRQTEDESEEEIEYLSREEQAELDKAKMRDRDLGILAVLCVFRMAQEKDTFLLSDVVNKLREEEPFKSSSSEILLKKILIRVFGQIFSAGNFKPNSTGIEDESADTISGGLIVQDWILTNEQMDILRKNTGSFSLDYAVTVLAHDYPDIPQQIRQILCIKHPEGKTFVIRHPEENGMAQTETVFEDIIFRTVRTEVDNE